MGGDGAFSHKIDCDTIFLEILNLEWHPSRITGSRVTAILLNGWILPTGGASATEGLQSTGLPRLVFFSLFKYQFSFLVQINIKIPLLPQRVNRRTFE